LADREYFVNDEERIAAKLKDELKYHSLLSMQPMSRTAWSDKKGDNKEFVNLSGARGMLRAMILCPDCQQPATKRDGYDNQNRQRYACRPCRRDFTTDSTSAFSGYRWPPDVILTAVRWYASYPLSATHVMQLLAERHIGVSARTLLNWGQPFGPQLAKAVSHYTTTSGTAVVRG